MYSWLVVLLSLLAVGARCRAQECNSSIMVDITSSGAVTLPSDNNLLLQANLTLPVSWRINDTDSDECENATTCEYPDRLQDADVFSVLVTNGIYEFFLTVYVSDEAVVCSDLTLGMSLPSDMNLIINCNPVTSCTNLNNRVTRFIWQIRHFLTKDWTTLQAGTTYPPEEITAELDIEREEGKNVINRANMTLNITEMTQIMLGYYRVISNTGDMLSNFTLFFGPVFTDIYRYSVNVIEGRSKILIPCYYESFPPAEVVWQKVQENMTVTLDDTSSRYSFVNITESEENVSMPMDMVDLTWTRNGGLIIHDVIREDRGTYKCEAFNGFIVTNESVIFRVRDPLRPLWPALGIIGVFIITSIFIFTGYIFDKLKEEKDRSIEPSEIDGEQEAALQGRPSVISIETEDENATIQKRTHSDGYSK